MFTVITPCFRTPFVFGHPLFFTEMIVFSVRKHVFVFEFDWSSKGDYCDGNLLFPFLFRYIFFPGTFIILRCLKSSTSVGFLYLRWRGMMNIHIGRNTCITARHHCDDVVAAGPWNTSVFAIGPVTPVTVNLVFCHNFRCAINAIVTIFLACWIKNTSWTYKLELPLEHNECMSFWPSRTNHHL